MTEGNQIQEPEAAAPDLSAYIAVAIVEWSKRYGATGPDGKPQADTGQALAALADVAGELVSRLPMRQQRLVARSGFEARFRRSVKVMGRG